MNIVDKDISDESQMALFQRGEGQAFQVLFDRYSARLINFAYRFLKTKEEAEDIAQEVLLRIHLKKESYDARKPFRPWIFAITARLISNKLRDKKRHPHQSLDATYTDESGEDRPLDVPDKISLNPEGQIEQRNVVQAVQRALGDLPENQRMAVLLARFEEMSYDQIAATLGLSLDSVTSLLYRARQTLKKHLSAYSPKK